MRHFFFLLCSIARSCDHQESSFGAVYYLRSLDDLSFRGKKGLLAIWNTKAKSGVFEKDLLVAQAQVPSLTIGTKKITNLSNLVISMTLPCLFSRFWKEHQILVNEMLGSTDENEPLQVMMKDQFANYVVQKVLETCDDQQLKLILNRIKVHLNGLKKYTYKKHIVTHVEKLVAAGERRIGVLS
ncbi:hypothetical protein F0562_020081 [Nyssa sinensis]|uniref:PUM-HD domain-containing protein n=1 Tax=Nyssa sinensis TaxID=561372 RepID=A0A5J5BU65_9ASTE|nr:hypothetical protein F0562_020081 [Nyssa sinensis]